jgi:16S rRNA (uracil1498-N3)-methyltransferase
MIRLFVPDDLKPDAHIRPSAEQAHYLLGVMRRGAGDEVLLFNGRDGEWRAVLRAVTKKSCELAPAERTREQSGGPDLELIVALVKRARLETIVEKAAELGAARVRLLITQFTNADHTNVSRLQAIATEAAEQTGRLDVPEVIAPVKLGVLLDGWADRPLMFCDEAGDAKPVGEALATTRPPSRPSAASSPSGGAIIIGPEGGFSPEERQRLRGLPFVVPVSLGPRILRADTAAISALTLWQAAIGDWR